MIDQQTPSNKRPRAEPEIILPDRAETRSSGDTSRLWVLSGERGTHRVYVAKVGPFGIILLALTISILFVLLLGILLGAFLIWIPLIGLIVAAAIISGLFRSHFRRHLAKSNRSLFG